MSLYIGYMVKPRANVISPFARQRAHTKTTGHITILELRRPLDQAS